MVDVTSRGELRSGDFEKAMATLDPKGMAADIGIPFHPGAAKFYKEAGITVQVH